MTWQLQFTGLPVDPSFNVTMYDIDMFDSDASLVTALHAQGRKVVCYISVGSREDWRPDADQFPLAVLGNDYEGWPGEQWLDIRQIDLLAPIMRARFDLCKAKGFDGVDPDNVDGYQNNTGFPLTYQDQIAYNRWLADEAHARSLAIGLKNDSDQVGDLLAYFEWAVTEDCFDQSWCSQMSPFIQAGKAVFAIEYTDTGMTTNQFCPQANLLGFSGILKHRNLDAWQQICGTLSMFRIERQTANVFGDGAYFCSLASNCFNSANGADIGERIEASEALEPGDVVEVDPSRPRYYRKARGSAWVVGVIASNPGFILGNYASGLPESRPAVALLGRVRVKVTATNGPIQPGDLLTLARKPGYAMRCSIPCARPIIAKALQYSVGNESFVEALTLQP
jgi:endo-alpha-1,4-polygalactosaminidase (GH114 family)